MNKIYTCPHCSIDIEIAQLNCGIFRCGIFQLKNGSFRQLPKHGTQDNIQKIKDNFLVYGCGNPIKYNNIEDKLVSTNWNS